MDVGSACLDNHHGQMLALATSARSVILRTALTYVVVLIGLRLASKREMEQLTVFDLVVLLLIANGVRIARVGPDTSLTGGALAAAVLRSIRQVPNVIGTMLFQGARRFATGQLYQ